MKKLHTVPDRLAFKINFVLGFEWSAARKILFKCIFKKIN